LFPLFATGVVDTGGKLTLHGINDTSGTGENLPPVSLIPWFTLTFKKFEITIKPFPGASGKVDSRKKPEAKNLVTLSL
jgi:hypothetical protein